MIDLFGCVKSVAEKKNKENAKNMIQTIVFENDKVVENKETQEETIIDITTPNTNSKNNKQSDLRTFVDEVYKIKTEIKRINTNVDKIAELKNKINLAVTAEEENELSLKLNELIKEINDIIQIVKAEIRSLRTKFISKSNIHRNIKNDIHLNLVSIFKKTLYDYQDIQSLYHHSVKDKITRHVKIIYPDYTEQELNQIINNEQVDTRSIVKWSLQGHEDLKNALDEVETKYKDVRILEKSVHDLHQTIIELGALIEMNDEVIDSIQVNVQDAIDYTEQANVDLLDAKKIQDKTSKWMWYITAGIVVVIIIISLALVLK